MLKILLIIKREYLVRVRKKSFLIMTILGPILMASLLIIPIYLSNKGDDVSDNNLFFLAAIIAPEKPIQSVRC